MVDELYEQYRQWTHQDLYDRLITGDPAQVESLVTTWKTIETTMSGLAASLRADLDRLVQSWDSAAGWEFHYRVSLIAAYAQMLAEEFASLHNGLSAMSGALADAKGEAEPPEAVPVEPLGNPVASAALGGLTTVVTGVVTGNMGHQPDPAAKRRAHERIARVVAGVAGEYRVAEYSTWPASVPTAPPEMPKRNSSSPVPTNLQVQGTVAPSGSGTTTPGKSPGTIPGTNKGGTHHSDAFGQGSPGHGQGSSGSHGSSGSSGTKSPTVPVASTGAGTWLETTPAVVGPVGSAATAPVAATGLANPTTGGMGMTDDVRPVGGAPRGMNPGVIGGAGDSTTTSTGQGGASGGHGGGGSGGHGGGGGGGSGGHGGGGGGGGGHSSAGPIGTTGDPDGRPAALPPATPTSLAAAGPAQPAAGPAQAAGGIMPGPAAEDHRRWLTAGNVVWRGDEDTSSPAVLGSEPDEPQFD